MNVSQDGSHLHEDYQIDHIFIVSCIVSHRDGTFCFIESPLR
jgi:hypothetical protein